MAKNRYGWNKRVKELARKMKQEEKIKRRQHKTEEKPAEDSLEPELPENTPAGGE